MGNNQTKQLTNRWDVYTVTRQIKKASMARQ